MFPQVNCQWEEKGVSEVKGCLSEDKCQYTGDIVHNARGDVITVYTIFTGKTVTSLPHPVVCEDPKFSHFLFSHTPNHWSPLEISLELAQRIWWWVVTEHRSNKIQGEQSPGNKLRTGINVCGWFLCVGFYVFQLPILITCGSHD